MKLSIIVPVYGVERYILEFAESLVYQLIDEVELIVINDGTKDNSIALFKEFVEKNELTSKNIVWLEQENQGQSVARNYGISNAKGEYITFLDPDDYVSNCYLSVLLELFETQADIYHFNADIVNNIGKYIGEIKLAENNDVVDVSAEEIIKIYKKCKWFSWLRVIRKELLNNNFFPPNVNYQDMMAFPKLYKKAEKIKNIDKILVFYRVHNNSSVNVFRPKLLISSDFGMKLYNNNEELDKVIYKQFLDLRLNLTLNSEGLMSAINWYYKCVYGDRNQILSNSISNGFYHISKLIVMQMYRFIKLTILRR